MMASIEYSGVKSPGAVFMVFGRIAGADAIVAVDAHHITGVGFQWSATFEDNLQGQRGCGQPEQHGGGDDGDDNHGHVYPGARTSAKIIEADVFGFDTQRIQHLTTRRKHQRRPAKIVFNLFRRWMILQVVFQ